jgi:multidrug efflux pump subunit AcrB
MLYSRDHVQDKFTSLNGVANVFLGGFVNREINIWVDNNKLNARQLTAEDVINTIEHQHQETPAGALETSDVQYNIRVMGEAYTVPDFANLPIITRGGTPNYTLTRLKDIATIEDGVVTPITRMARFDGVPTVGLGIVMQDGFNAVEVGDEAKAQMEEVKKQLPKGYHLSLNFDTTKFIRDNVHELELTILLATFLTASVCFLFLGSFSSTVNIFLAIPTSIFGTFMVIALFGFNLNTFTLMALSLSIGVVVDDAIMVLENIVRHQERGEDQVEAALVGAREITFAATATSLAIVAIFLPIAFMQGIIGKFFYQFGVTLSGAVLISLLEAITLTPMRCSEFVHAGSEHGRFNKFINNKFEALKNWYKATLQWCLYWNSELMLKAFNRKRYFLAFGAFLLLGGACLWGLHFLTAGSSPIVFIIALGLYLFGALIFIFLLFAGEETVVSQVRKELKDPKYSAFFWGYLGLGIILLGILHRWTTDPGPNIFKTVLGLFVLGILYFLWAKRHFIYSHLLYDHKWWVLTVSSFIFLVSLLFPWLKIIPMNFNPSTDQSAFIVNMKLPVTYSLEHTDRIVRQCEAILKQRAEVKHLFAPLGGFGGATPNQGVFFLTMQEPGDRPKADISEKFKPAGPLGFLTTLWWKLKPPVLIQAEFMSVVRKALSKVSPDLQVYCLDFSQRGMSTGQGYQVELMVMGPDWDTLGDCVKKIRKALRASPKLADVNDNFLDGQPELRIVPDRVKAAQMGVAMDDLGNVVSATIGGYQFEGTYFHEGGHDNPIAIRVPVDQRKGPEALKTVYVRNNRNEVLPISAMSNVLQVPSYQQIFRDMRQRAVYITANAGSGTSQADALQEAVNLCKGILPEGYQVQLTGSAKASNDSINQLMFVMILGILVAYMVLASQFNSFIHPIVILLALPFSVTGAFFSMWLFNQSLGIYSIIGILLLLGLVKKNSIMLVDFTNQRRRRGMDLHSALMDACPVRLRPILMTSSATVAGALPAALAWGPGAELRQPMALAIIGGIIFSTILTLVVVPCAYHITTGLERRKAHHAKGIGQHHEDGGDSHHDGGMGQRIGKLRARKR